MHLIEHEIVSLQADIEKLNDKVRLYAKSKHQTFIYDGERLEPKIT